MLVQRKRESRRGQQACAETEDFIKTFYVEIYIRIHTHTLAHTYTQTLAATLTPATAAIKPNTAEFHAGIVRFMTHGVGGKRSQKRRRRSKQTLTLRTLAMFAIKAARKPLPPAAGHITNIADFFGRFAVVFPTRCCCCIIKLSCRQTTTTMQFNIVQVNGKYALENMDQATQLAFFEHKIKLCKRVSCGAWASTTSTAREFKCLIVAGLSRKLKL